MARSTLPLVAAAALLCSGLAHSAPVLNMTADASGWAAVRASLESWSALQFDTAFSVNVGDASGPLFSWNTPGFSVDNTRMQGASLSKWPSSVMISGLVADGTLSYDDLASKHLKYWATDPADPRSAVTLRHLLSFTSGFLDDADVPCANENFGFERCAEKLVSAHAQLQH